MRKRTPTPPDTFPSILGRVLRNGRGTMSTTVARQVLKIGFDQAGQDRVADLLDRNSEGKLTTAEKAELNEFVRAANVVAILQSHARMALKRAGKKA